MFTVGVNIKGEEQKNRVLEIGDTDDFKAARNAVVEYFGADNIERLLVCIKGGKK